MRVGSTLLNLKTVTRILFGASPQRYTPHNNCTRKAVVQYEIDSRYVPNSFQTTMPSPFLHEIDPRQIRDTYQTEGTHTNLDATLKCVRALPHARGMHIVYLANRNSNSFRRITAKLTQPNRYTRKAVIKYETGYR